MQKVYPKFSGCGLYGNKPGTLFNIINLIRTFLLDRVGARGKMMYL